MYSAVPTYHAAIPWPTFWAKNWHTGYFSSGQRLLQFWFFWDFWLSNYEPVRDRRTDGWTGRPHNKDCMHYSISNSAKQATSSSSSSSSSPAAAAAAALCRRAALYSVQCIQCSNSLLLLLLLAEYWDKHDDVQSLQRSGGRLELRGVTRNRARICACFAPYLKNDISCTKYVKIIVVHCIICNLISYRKRLCKIKLHKAERQRTDL